MMKEIKIKIPELGKAVGTTAWLSRQLENAEIKLSSLKYHNLPGLWIKLPYLQSKKPDSAAVWSFLCHIGQTPYDCYNDYDSDLGVTKAVLVDDPNNPNIEGLFPTLTNNAERYAEKWANAVIEKFVEEYHKL